jgi:nitroimidazol reductase NimA-like FMN-containing flavoprotein (pyridoxamine 5'-phosphate oxidase superfamily)
MASPLERDDVAALLAATPFADVAVSTRLGPHVTPAAFAAADGRLWVVSSRRTVRVGAVRRTRVASALVRSGERSLVVSGRASVLSMWRRDEATALLAGALPASRAAALYAARNLRTVAGFAVDTVLGSGDLSVYDRVLLAVDADRGMLLDGTELVERWGRWSAAAGRGEATRARRTAASLPALDDLLAGVPADAATALDRDDTASLAVLDAAGPVVLPALGGIDGGRLAVATAALDLAGAPARGPACATAHDSHGIRPSSFRGVVLRGEGRLLRRSALVCRVTVTADRVSWWSGFDAGTSRGVAA